MKFSFLGFNSHARPLAEAILAHPEHQFVAVYHPDPEFPAEDFPGVQQEEAWEAVLHISESAIVVIAPLNDIAEQEDRLRRVVQCELPAIALQPFCTVLAAFEMEMIQAQTDAPLICYTPADYHPFRNELANWLAEATTSPVGRIWQIAIHSNPRAMNRDHVLKQLAYDVAVVRNVAGPVRQVSAVTNSAAEDHFDNLNVTFTTDSSALFAWYLDRSIVDHPCELRLHGADGDLVVQLSNQHACWHVPGNPPSRPIEAATAFLATLPGRLDPTANDRSWVNWCQDLDVAETVPTSLRRRRSIDILDEPRTEEGSFKGVMSMGSCALLLATLFILLAGTILDGFRFPAKKNSYRLAEPADGLSTDSAAPTRSLWIRLWPVYPFALFLLLQLLRFAIQQPGSRPSATIAASQEPRAPPD